MPNGDDKNWVRFLGAVDGFRARHGTWPTRVRMFADCLTDLRNHLFSPEAFARLSAKLELVAGEASIVAEDDAGNSYSYGEEGFPSQPPTPDAGTWLDVSPDRAD